MDKYKSRRYVSAWRLTWLSTALLVLPWLAKVFLDLDTSSIITPDIWSMTITIIWGSYFTANTVSKGLMAWNKAQVGEAIDPETFDKAG